MTEQGFSVAIELDGDGAHPSAWRAASHAPSELLTPRRVASTVQDAERYGFGIATFEDSPLAPGESPDVIARLDAVQRAAFVAPLTSGIGLVPVAHVVYSEPFHVATQLASLDYSSYGRAGWIVAASGTDAEARAFDRDPVTDAGDLRREATDVIEVSRRLWDSWEDDAVIRDAATGRYLDADKLHYVDFEGSRFSVKGPSIIPRPLQGQVVVFAQEGTADPAGIDVSLVSAADEAGIGAAVGASRASGVPRVFVELDVALDSRGVAAAQRIAELDAHTPWSLGDRLRYQGDAEGLIELLRRLATVADGVRLHPAVIDVDLHEIGRAVLPALRRDGTLVSPRPGGTLRDALGLARPTNRYAA